MTTLLVWRRLSRLGNVVSMITRDALQSSLVYLQINSCFVTHMCLSISRIEMHERRRWRGKERKGKKSNTSIDKEEKKERKEAISHSQWERWSNEYDTSSHQQMRYFLKTREKNIGPLRFWFCHVSFMLRSVFLSVSDRINTSTRRNTMPLLDRPSGATNSSSIPYVQIDQPSSTSVNGTPVVNHDRYLRAKLRFFLMSPCWKWHLKRQCPWKAWFQFLKIILITAQVEWLVWQEERLWPSLSLLVDSVRYWTTSACDIHRGE